MRKFLLILTLLILLLANTGSALAQTYYFQVLQFDVHVFWNSDGSMSFDYVWTFKNDSKDPIEYVDLTVPKGTFSETNIFADVDGKAITDISRNGYQGSGVGMALGLGANSIPSGKTGKVHAFVGAVERVVYPDDQDQNYASAVFSPKYFDTSTTHGNTDLTITFHLPPGVQPDEPRWHKAPDDFPAEPEPGHDNEGRITYTWHNPNANSTTMYDFGASFPKKYIPDSAIVRTNIFEAIIGGLVLAVSGATQCLIPLLCVGGFGAIIVASIVGDRKRRMQYLPPKISIEGHGIKRGLTAVEAAILMEEPIDKVLTMILFSLVKKNSAEVVKRDPLGVRAIEPLPEELRYYEKEFLEAVQKDGATRRRAMQDLVVHLARAVSDKVKGFSRKESVAYYKTIMEKAWSAVEAANTPEVKSQKFDEVMEWTMLDRDYSDRTRDVFRHQPVFVPIWWGRYDPGFGRSVSTGPAPTLPSGLSSMPRVPGADFAASIVTGVQNFSSNVVGNISDFTSRVTQVTNPVPVSTSSGSSHRSSGGGGGGRSCACACACAGCACACAGGGR